MNRTERISVILPTYNRAGTIGRAIRSVLAQTHSDLNVIVVDDASTDDTAAAVAEVHDERIRYMRLPKNLGPAGARNAGIHASTTRWVAFQDSDDEWLPMKLEDQLPIVRASPDVALVIGGYSIVSGDRLIDIVPVRTLLGEDPLPDLLDGWPVITPTWLARRDILLELGGFDESLRCLEDWDLIFRLTDRHPIRAVRGPVLVKHSSADSVFGSLSAQRVALATILERHGQRCRRDRQRLARHVAHLGTLESRLGHRTAATRHLVSALLLDPRKMEYYDLLVAALRGPGATDRATERWPAWGELPS